MLGQRLYPALAICCLLVLSSLGAYGQDDASELTVYAGMTTYPNPIYDSMVLVEFPFSLNRHELDFYRKDSIHTDLYAYVFAQVNLFNTAGLPVDSVNTYFSVRVDSRDEAALQGYRVFNRVVRLVEPGRYSARLAVIDVASKRRGEFFLGDFVVDSVVTERIVIGGVSLAYSMEYIGDNDSGPNSRLVKSGFRVIPNPVSIFSQEDDSVIYLYGEVYNLAYSEDVPSSCMLSFSAWNEDGNLFRHLGSEPLEKPDSSAVIAKSFKIIGWPPGRYHLQIVALDHTTGDVDTASVPLVILPPKEVLLASLKPVSGDPHDTLSLDVKVNLVTYLLTPDQKAILAHLTDAGKLNFLNQYWREQDVDPSTSIVENRLELIERYVYCNRFFSTDTGKTDGWATDRGRIYMTYGQWEEIDDRPAPLIGNAYQIWYYHSLKEGKVFVFDDRTGNNDYRLVHSNVYGEVYSKEWENLLRGHFPDFTDDY
jgi:GWxTD domain-containing protein